MTVRKIIALSQDVSPWEQQPGESVDHYTRFRLYLEMGSKDRVDPLVTAPPRSLRQLLEILLATGSRVRSYATLRQYASKFRWSERAQAYDAEQWAEERRKWLRLRREAADRHRKQGIAMQGKGTQALAAIPVMAVSMTEAARLITEGARLELAALGEAAAPTQTPAPGGAGASSGGDAGADTTHWTPQQRRQRFAQILAESGFRSGLASQDDEDDEVV